jgi:hypothetical protein
MFVYIFLDILQIFILYTFIMAEHKAAFASHEVESELLYFKSIEDITNHVVANSGLESNEKLEVYTLNVVEAAQPGYYNLNMIVINPINQDKKVLVYENEPLSRVMALGLLENTLSSQLQPSKVIKPKKPKLTEVSAEKINHGYKPGEFREDVLLPVGKGIFSFLTLKFLRGSEKPSQKKEVAVQSIQSLKLLGLENVNDVADFNKILNNASSGIQYYKGEFVSSKIKPTTLEGNISFETNKALPMSSAVLKDGLDNVRDLLEKTIQSSNQLNGLVD